MLNSHRMFLERYRSGALRKFPVVCPRRPRICSWMDARSTRTARAPRGRISEERMHGLDARPLTVDLGPRIGLVQLDVSDPPAEADGHPPLAALLEALQDVVL